MVSINFNSIAERVNTWNSIAGMDTEDDKALEEQIKLYVELCHEETGEGYDAVIADTGERLANPDYQEVLDMAVDNFVVLSRLITLLSRRGFSVNTAFERVLENNDTKFIDNTYEGLGGDLPEVILENIHYYKQKNIEVIYKYNKDHDKFILFNRATGKILKPKEFESVNISDLVPEDLL